MPSHDCLHRWRREHPEFNDKYEAARLARADVRADRMDDYVEQMLRGDLDPNVVRVALAHERWQAGREAPKRFGDRLAIDADVTLQPVQFIVERSARPAKRGDGV